MDDGSRIDEFYDHGAQLEAEQLPSGSYDTLLGSDVLAELVATEDDPNRAWRRFRSATRLGRLSRWTPPGLLIPLGTAAFLFAVANLWYLVFPLKTTAVLDEQYLDPAYAAPFVLVAVVGVAAILVGLRIVRSRVRFGQAFAELKDRAAAG